VSLIKVDEGPEKVDIIVPLSSLGFWRGAPRKTKLLLNKIQEKKKKKKKNKKKKKKKKKPSISKY